MLLSTINPSGSLQAAEQGGAGGSNFLLLGLMLVVVIVFLVLPMRRQKKARQQMQERQQAMTPGTRVMTQFGVFGTIVSIDREANRAVIEVAPKTEITVHLGAVTTVLDQNGQVPGTPEAARAAAAQGVTDQPQQGTGEFQGEASQSGPGFGSSAPAAENDPRLNGEPIQDERSQGFRDESQSGYREDRPEGDDNFGSSR
ncbi:MULTISPECIES: preprotein translocase subunit YajC [Micrococcaceae]|uniref:preprotein translocase subunit YajC n=1 Tax=unclassified Kocuria TaxID=2649579 RepID=UPI0010104213|nr:MULTISPECIES: preprotein translocase subunit YajC [unclassified Kocuria]